MAKYQVSCSPTTPGPIWTIERAILAEYDAELVVAPAIDTATLVALAPRPTRS